MSEKLDAYLEDISHYLSGREEREEILSEIRSHILEKAEREHGAVTEAALASVIAAFGPARRVAERYLDGQEIIAPAFRRYLFRYTSLIFAVHFLATAAAAIFKTSFYIFPLFFVPRLGVIEALLYLPTAFLCDLGIVTLLLYLITRSRKEIRLPWPKFGLDLDEVKPRKRLISDVLGLIFMTALTIAALYFYIQHHTIFFVNLDFARARPLFTPGPGSWLSLTFIGLFAVEALRLFIRLFTLSPWVDLVKSGISLVLVGLLFRWPVETAFAVSVPERLRPYIKLSLTIALFVVAALLAVDFIKALIIIGRKRLAKR